MAEPERASCLTAPSPRSRPKPRPPHPSRYAAPLRLPLDETQDLRPPGWVIDHLPAPPIEPESLDRPAEAPGGRRARRTTAPRPPSRSPGEWVLMAVVLLGLALNVSSLLTGAALSSSDRLLGSAVFLVGLALLVLMEICRRSGHASR